MSNKPMTLRLKSALTGCIVPLVLLRSSPLAGAITGQAMSVDGGMGLAVQY